MDQAEFIRRISDKTDKFVWFLGAGTSQSAGLPTAIDIIWDIKRRRYCTDENQPLTANDLQNAAVRSKIDSYMISKGFPATSDPAAYSLTFEMEFGDQAKRQREYIEAILADDRVTLATGHRVFGALLASDLIRCAFTTNFDGVVEKAVAEVGGKNLMPFHLEGSAAALEALNNEKFPLYVKLHGDFRFEGLKNLAEDLKNQDHALGRAFVAAGSRFGLIVSGYSGRDESVMSLMSDVLDAPNPYPHGVYWLGLKGREPLPVVAAFIDRAREKGIDAHFIEIETFDSLLSRIWNQVKLPDEGLRAKIGRAKLKSVSIPLPGPGTRAPLIRLNALPVVDVPTQCLELTLQAEKDWKELQAIEGQSHDRLICTKGSKVLAWGNTLALNAGFGANLKSATPVAISGELNALEHNLHLKGFLERALCLGLKRRKPLLYRRWRDGSVLIADPKRDANHALAPLTKMCSGSLAGIVPGVMTEITEQHATSEAVHWAEAVKVDFEVIDGACWVTLRPEVWIWPPRSRRTATEFIRNRARSRFNNVSVGILGAWIDLLLPGTADAELEVSPFDDLPGAANPLFKVRRRTAFSKGLGL
jgi:hypothetical protein